MNAKGECQEYLRQVMDVTIVSVSTRGLRLAARPSSTLPPRPKCFACRCFFVWNCYFKVDKLSKIVESTVDRLGLLHPKKDFDIFGFFGTCILRVFVNTPIL